MRSLHNRARAKVGRSALRTRSMLRRMRLVDASRVKGATAS
jgi:hypothetical protein